MRLDDDLKYFEEPEFKDILAKYEAAREAGQAVYLDADDLTDVAEYYAMVHNDNERADEAIQLARQLHPDAVSPQIFVARQAMQEGNIEEARQLCDAIEDQDHREVHFLRAELLIREEKSNEAFSYLLHVSKTVDEDLDYFLYDSAYIFVDYRDFESALTFANHLKDMAPAWFKTWELQADVLLGLENYRSSLKYIEKMLDKDPFYVEAWNWRAEAYSGLFELDKALESTDYALAVAPRDERALQLKAWATMQNGNPEEAHKIYLELQQMNPDSEQHWLYDSYCLYDMGNREEAMRVLLQAEKMAEGMSVDQVSIYRHHAHLLSDNGEIDEALRYIDWAELEQEDTSMWLEYSIMRAQVYADNGYVTQAMSIIEEATQHENADVPDILFRGGQVMFDATLFDVAAELFLRHNQLTKDTEQVHATYAYLAAISHELHRPTEAISFLKKAVQFQASNLKEVFGYILPQDVAVADYCDYYFYHGYGRWPDSAR